MANVRQLPQFAWTPGTEEAFLDKLADTGSVWGAARLVGCARSTAYRHRDEDEGFAAKWAEATKAAVARFEKAAIQRAVVGIDEPVFHEGEICGYKRRYSDTLLIRVLEAHDPRYRTRNIEMPAVTINVVNVITDANEQARARAQSLRSPQPAIIDAAKK